MPWAQSVKAFQKRFETGNSLSLGLADLLARASGISHRAHLGVVQVSRISSAANFFQFSKNSLQNL
jgi:hypothetical protein